MKHAFRYAAAIALFLVSSSSLFAQGYPLPQVTGTTTAQTACPGCPAIRTDTNAANKPVLPTPQFSTPFAAFTGRYLDSVFANDYQACFRTGRAWDSIYVPERNRIYMMIGSAVVAYNADTFFQHLESRQTLMSSQTINTSASGTW